MRSSTRIRLRSDTDFPAWQAAAWAPAPAPEALPSQPDAAAGGDDLADQEAVHREDLEALEEVLRAELEERVAEAYREGFEAGHTAGAEAAAAELSSARSAAIEAAAEIRAREADWAGVLEENVCAVATAVARRILDRELETDRLVVLEMARAAVERFGLEESLRIRLNPDDHAVLAQAEGGAAELAASLEGRAVQWIADAGIDAGGCVVEGRERIVDGRVDTALARAYRMLTGQNA